jgi:C4-dicarboxylate transporter, DctQ subunit
MSNAPLTSHASTVGRWLRRRAENVMVALLSVMFATFIIQIFARYVLNNPVGWSEEVIITAWLWTVLWGAAFVVSEAEEIRFDIIYSNLSEQVRRILTIITGIVLVALYGISLPASYSYVSFMKVERSAYLHVPINLMYSIYIIFLVACIGRYCWLIVDALRGGRPPATDAASLSD